MENSKKFIENVKKLCYKYGIDEDCVSRGDVEETTDDINIYLEDIADMLDELDSKFDPIIEWDFQSVFSFKASGDYMFAHNYRRDRIFGQNGYLLCESIGNFTCEVFNCSEIDEIWLLDDMSIVFAECFCIEIGGYDGQYKLEYRNQISEPNDFELDYFLEQVKDRMMTKCI